MDDPSTFSTIFPFHRPILCIWCIAAGNVDVAGEVQRKGEIFFVENALCTFSMETVQAPVQP